MTKIDIFSGFLGAGKTTLIKKLISEAYKGEKLVLIENEFGDIAIDGGFLQDSGVQITEMSSGCICCSLTGDFREALGQVMDKFSPDRILIEPSGVGKLSDIIRAVQSIGRADLSMNAAVAVADAVKCKMYIKNFGEFYKDQVGYAGAVILSRTDGISSDKLEETLALLRTLNETAEMITTPWDKLTGAQILASIEHRDTLELELSRIAEEDGDDACPVCGHHYDHEHEHHHDHDEDHEHHHDHNHEHDHEHDHGHHHHHSHDADEVFMSWGTETTRKYTADEIKNALDAISDESKYGVILRAKGIIAGKDGEWIHFDYVPGEQNIRTGSAATTGRLCIIGSALNESAVAALFKAAK
ncbi:MAG: GTP-binding protein [Oscillospiraceae bacterium]